MSQFFWYQTRGETQWLLAQSEQRSSILLDKAPEFMTVLDADSVPGEDWEPKQYLDMKYYGPFYMDWDAEDVQDAIADFQTTLQALEDKGLNLECCRLYATGGRGFHIEVPMECFISKPNKAGYPQLPAIYREMAEKFQTGTSDMRIYTARRGRMWRVQNVQRPNGKYKVLLKPEEALGMTPELYDEITSKPRYGFIPAEPELCLDLATEFAAAKNKVDRQLSVRKRAKDEADALRQFEDRLPPAAKSIAAGIGYNPSKGFNQIAMQLAITYSAAGKEVDQFLQDCAGLIQNHKGDGSRYNSPRKRKEALRDLFLYVSGCDLYSYSSSGLKSICDPDAGLDTADAGALNYSAYTEEAGEEAERDSRAEALFDFRRFRGVSIRPTGIYQRLKDDEDEDVLSNARISNTVLGVDPEDGHVTALSMTITNNMGRTFNAIIPMEAFSTTRTLDEFFVKYACNFVGREQTSNIVRQILTEQASKEDKLIYTTNKEGLDTATINADGSGREVNMWVTNNKVWVYDPSGGPKVSMRFVPPLGTKATYKSDLFDAPETFDEKDKELLQHLFRINSPATVGAVLGWFTACFQKQYFQREGGQFPLLHPAGQAGAGKTQTIELISHMHYYKARPMMMASGTVTTPFALKSAMASSASLPLILDEYKPREMGKNRHNLLMQMFRSLYNQQAIASGGISDGTGRASYRDLSHLELSAPVCFIGETPEDQAAIAERSVTVSFVAKEANKEAWWEARGARSTLSKLGKAIAIASMTESKERFSQRFNEQLRVVREAAGNHRVELLPRVEYNVVVILCGLEILRRSLKSAFNDAFDREIDRLKGAFLTHHVAGVRKVVPEYVRTLAAMSMCSYSEDVSTDFILQEGRDYCYSEDGESLDISMYPAFIRYRAWALRAGAEVYYPSPESFVQSFTGLQHIVKDTRCPDSPLRAVPGMKGSRSIFRLSVQQMQLEGIELFKSRTLN